MAEVYEKYFEYYMIQWRSTDKKSHYSQKWTDLNHDICPEVVYKAYCNGNSVHDIYCIPSEKEAIKCFHIILKKRKTDEKFKNLMKDCDVRLVHIKKLVKMETTQIVQS